MEAKLFLLEIEIEGTVGDKGPGTSTRRPVLKDLRGNAERSLQASTLLQPACLFIFFSLRYKLLDWAYHACRVSCRVSVHAHAHSNCQRSSFRICRLLV